MIPEAFAENYRQWKLKLRKEKPRKRKRAAEEPLEEGELSGPNQSEIFGMIRTSITNPLCL